MSDNQMIHLTVPREMYRALNRLKAAQNKTLSAVVREAISAHVETSVGDVVPPVIAWGGWRAKPTEDED